jgi:putative nucleotidyltransferase with HDIG domain
MSTARRLGVLFVDDEPLVLQGLRRMLRSQQLVWDMQFAGSGAEALALLDRSPVDVVVADMRMPGMDGAALLEAVRTRHPGVVRIVLSGEPSAESAQRLVHCAHRFLDKPASREQIASVIDQAMALEQLLRDRDLAQVVAGLDTLPSAPHTFGRLQQALRAPGVSAAQIGALAAKDAALSAKLLQMVNSAFFGLARVVRAPGEAVILLGIQRVAALVLVAELVGRISPHVARALRLQQLWQHCLRTGAIAERIAQREALTPPLRETVAVAGLLHDVGKLALAVALPERYRELLAQGPDVGRSDPAAEQKLLGSDHARVGAYLMSLWGLPGDVVQAIAFHHPPSAAGPDIVARIGEAALLVHAADRLEHALDAHLPNPPALAAIPADRCARWWALANETLGSAGP